jgi:hypothetical protein
MMQCRDIDELLMDFLYQELDAEKTEAFRSHVDSCARCGQEIASLSRTRQALQALPEAEPSPAVTARLLHEAGKRAVRAESGGLLGWLHRLIGPVVAHPAWAAAASLILVAGVAGFLSLRGKVTGQAQEVAVESAPAAMSAPAAAAPAPPPRDRPAATEEPRPAEVRDLGEGARADYAPKVPAPAVAQPPPAKAKEKARASLDSDPADRRRLGRTASTEEDLKLSAKPAERKSAPAKKEAANLAGDDFGGVAAAPPPPAEASQPRDLEKKSEVAASEGEREQAAAGGKGQRLEDAPAKEPPAGPASTLSARGYAGAPEPSPAPSAPPPQTQAPAPAQTKSLAQNADEVQSKQTKEPPEQELFRLAQKQATSGLCVEALGNRDKIARMNAEFYRKRVAGDPSLRACEEQQQRSKRPARQKDGLRAPAEAVETQKAN